MSIEAIHWVLNYAPDFAGEDPRQRPHLAIVLIGLANHADPDGRNAFPAIATLCRYIRLSESTVRRCLQRLVELGVIRAADQHIVAAYIRRADRRPNGYDLAMAPVPGDNPVDSAGDNPLDGVSYEPGDRSNNGVSQRSTGVSYQTGGVSYQVPRGVTPARKPAPYDTRTLLEPSRNRPAHERTPGARSSRIPTRPPIPPPCGQCDTRPDDPITARVVWLDADRTRSRRCPRCHPHARPAEGGYR